jgi:nitroreductase / dihydropteridine reductase
MNLIESLQWRYATKKMNGEKVPSDKLERILEAIKLAPSSYGLTPYTVLVIEDADTKAKLQPACYGQSQVVDSSAVIVFANWTTIDNNKVDEFIQDVADQRGMDVTNLTDYSNYIKGAISNLTDEQKQTWASKQTYIALGVGLVAAASEGVDSTPMEGFIPSQVNEVLGLNDLGLSASVILTLGYRDAANDYLANLKKVRRSSDKLFIKK